MSKNIVEPTITVNQAKILYMMVNNNITSFGAGDFGTDVDSFQPVADAIDDLIERGMIVSDSTERWHRESRKARQRDRILKCRITERGSAEFDKVRENWLYSKGEFSLETWADDASELEAISNHLQ